MVVGRYRLIQPVGRGGMGAVWHASVQLPYICSETRLTTYGDDKYSTQSFKRISHSP